MACSSHTTMSLFTACSRLGSLKGKKITTITRLIKRQVQGDSKQLHWGTCHSKDSSHARHVPWHTYYLRNTSPWQPRQGLSEVLATLQLSCSQQSSSPGHLAQQQVTGPGKDLDTWWRQTEQRQEHRATGTRQSKAFKARRAAFHPTSACSPEGFKTSLSPAARRKTLSSSHSKHWLCEGVAKASKALREISIVPFTCNTLRRHLE